MDRAATHSYAVPMSMEPWAAEKKLYTSVEVTPTPARVPTQRHLVPSLMSVVGYTPSLLTSNLFTITAIYHSKSYPILITRLDALHFRPNPLMKISTVIRRLRVILLSVCKLLRGQAEKFSV